MQQRKLQKNLTKEEFDYDKILFMYLLMCKHTDNQPLTPKITHHT